MACHVLTQEIRVDERACGACAVFREECLNFWSLQALSRVSLTNSDSAQNGGVISRMIGQVQLSQTDAGLVAQRLGDAGPEIVGYQCLRPRGDRRTRMDVRRWSRSGNLSA